MGETPLPQTTLTFDISLGSYCSLFFEVSSVALPEPDVELEEELELELELELEVDVELLEVLLFFISFVFVDPSPFLAAFIT